MVKNDTKSGQKWSKMVKTGQNDTKSGQNWSELVKTGQNWSKLKVFVKLFFRNLLPNFAEGLNKSWLELCLFCINKSE
jgi:hypothetical protein